MSLILHSWCPTNVDRHKQRPLLLDVPWNDPHSPHLVIRSGTSPAPKPWHAKGESIQPQAMTNGQFCSKTSLPTRKRQSSHKRLPVHFRLFRKQIDNGPTIRTTIYAPESQLGTPDEITLANILAPEIQSACDAT